jgi:hypothetical protein
MSHTFQTLDERVSYVTYKCSQPPALTSLVNETAAAAEMASLDASKLIVEMKSIQPYSTKDEYLIAMKEDLAEWFNSMYQTHITAQNFIEQLENGVIICFHANNVMRAALKVHTFKPTDLLNAGINPNSINSSSTLRTGVAGTPNSSKMFSNLTGEFILYKQDARPQSFQSRDNISNFIKWCRCVVKVRECLMFETDDLILRKNENNFILCLLEIARFGSKYGIQVPTIIKFELEIEAELEREKQAKRDELMSTNEPTAIYTNPIKENEITSKIVPDSDLNSKRRDETEFEASIEKQIELTDITVITETDLVSSTSMKQSSIIDIDKLKPAESHESSNSSHRESHGSLNSVTSLSNDESGVEETNDLVDEEEEANDRQIHVINEDLPLELNDSLENLNEHNLIREEATKKPERPIVESIDALSPTTSTTSTTSTDTNANIASANEFPNLLGQINAATSSGSESTSPMVPSPLSSSVSSSHSFTALNEGADVKPENVNTFYSVVDQVDQQRQAQTSQVRRSTESKIPTKIVKNLNSIFSGVEQARDAGSKKQSVEEPQKLSIGSIRSRSTSRERMNSQASSELTKTMVDSDVQYQSQNNLHRHVCSIADRCTCEKKFTVVKLGEGKYRIGNTKNIVFIRVSHFVLKTIKTKS